MLLIFPTIIINQIMQNRRKFILRALQAGSASLLFSIPAAGNTAPAKEYTVQDIMDIILKEIPEAPFKTTVDTLKSGKAGTKVTGIITTMFATSEVIDQAVQLKANFIIAHEPTFYNHTDDTNWTGSNEVVKKKQALLDQHGIAIWRCHDYWHTYRPDGILNGVLKKAGWLQYNSKVEPVFSIPSSSLKEIAEHLKKTLQIHHVKVVGDLQQKCQRIGLMPGAAGGQRQIVFTEKEKPDVLIIGETHEWETVEYIRDARNMGSSIALIILGHSVSEEPGMEWMAEWLQPKVPELKVTHIASKDPFTWM
jgi:putative NIF3 family GTP cyclohydrolase 1 type 2